MVGRGQLARGYKRELDCAPPLSQDGGAEGGGGGAAAAPARAGPGRSGLPQEGEGQVGHGEGWGRRGLALADAVSWQVVDHYENPRNVGSLDRNAKNVGTGLVGAPACGDVMKLQVTLGTRWVGSYGAVVRVKAAPVPSGNSTGFPHALCPGQGRSRSPGPGWGDPAELTRALKCPQNAPAGGSRRERQDRGRPLQNLRLRLGHRLQLAGHGVGQRENGEGAPGKLQSFPRACVLCWDHTKCPPGSPCSTLCCRSDCQHCYCRAIIAFLIRESLRWKIPLRTSRPTLPPALAASPLTTTPSATSTCFVLFFKNLVF